MNETDRCSYWLAVTTHSGKLIGTPLPDWHPMSPKCANFAQGLKRMLTEPKAGD